MQKRWTIKDADEDSILDLVSSLKIHPVLCRLLALRGVHTYNEAKTFFRPQLSDLHSPWLMKDMGKAVTRIITAFAKKEKILVYGDYDVDGTTSVASMYSFLKKTYDQVEYYLPHRYKEGYGISKTGIDYAIENKYTLIISLDCGIKSINHIQYAADNNIDFIVCDHHLPDDELPPAIAILNPKQVDCPYPYKELCGCGVGFKLITALAEKLGLPDTVVHDYLDLVATAIAADIVPITGENRILAYYGLKKVNENPNLGIKAIWQLSGFQKELDINGLVFMIAPRVNAAGRMDDARKAVQMFTSPNMEIALEQAEALHSDNTDRKEADQNTTREVLELIDGSVEMQSKKSTVVYQPHWHKGVVGIVASRIIEHYYRPTIVLTQSGDYAAGSARSVPGFNLYEAIHACKEHLIGYGGHFAAAGMTLHLDQIELFTEKFEKVVASTIDPHLLIPEITVDAEINFADINHAFYNIIKQMEPFGPENMRPVFLTKKVVNNGFSKIVKEKHIRFSVKQNGIAINGIGFNLAHKFSELTGNYIDIVYKIEENEWNGVKKLQLHVVDFRPS